MSLKFSFTIFWLILIIGSEASAMLLPSPKKHGQVILRNFTRGTALAPVIFDHWLHRAMFTCRLCHVDLGFSMQEGATKINADLNIQGYYCGSCHDGKRKHLGKEIFTACADTYTKDDENKCVICHSQGKISVRQHTYQSFTQKLPLLPGSKAIDWDKAEEMKLISPIDFLEGISIKRNALKEPENFSITSKASWASDVKFSHKKHVAWNGCEICHPDIFPSTEKGTIQYNMLQINRGQYCGACHLKVAFPVALCKQCHTNSVK